jgi:universal stress protein E
MKTPKQILVVISGRHTEHPALERALKFAEFDGVHIHLFNSIYEPVMELTDVLSSEHRKEMKRQYMADRYLYMDTIADSLDQKGVSCSVNVAWHRELHEAIEEVVDELEPDLVIKRISADASNINPFTMPVDRHLLRYCKAPLLLVRHSNWVNKPLLAAIDPSVLDQKHIALNHNILEYSKMLADVTKNSLHSVSAFETPNISSSMDVGWSNIDFENIKVETTKSHTIKIETLLKEHDLFICPYHVLEGRAEIAIPNIAKEIDAQLLILGTVGRTGLSGTFIGNTAEHILAHMNCDILTLKPNVN